MTIGEFMIINLAPCVGYSVCPMAYVGDKNHTTKYGLGDRVPQHVVDSKICSFSLDYITEGSAKGNVIYKFYI